MAIYRSDALVPVESGSALGKPRARAGPGPAAVYLARLAPSSRRTMKKCLDTLARLATNGLKLAQELPWEGIRYEHVQGLRARMASGTLSPSYVNLHLCALRGVLKEAWRLGLMDSESYMRAVDVQGLRGSRLPRGREVAAGEAGAVFDSLSGGAASPKKARNAALLATLHGGGLRRSELAQLELKHFDDDARTLRVLGKGNKERIVPLPEGALAALRAWVRIRGAWPGALFVPVNKGAKLARRHMTSEAVWHIIKRVALAAAVKPFAPHDMRRTYVTALFRKGVDGGTIQKLAGHAKLETTMRYDMRGEDEKSKAADLLHVPFRP